MWSTAPITVAAVVPSKARRPVAISCTIAPRAKMSLRASASWPASCSGAMYGYVPSTAPAAVSGTAPGETVDRASRSGVGCSFDKPEVEQLRARLGHHDVARLEITVDEPVSMRVVQRIGELDAASQEPRRSAVGLAADAPPASAPRGIPSRGTGSTGRLYRDSGLGASPTSCSAQMCE